MLVLLPERFQAKIELDQRGCWLWTGYVEPRGGYGRVKLGGRVEWAHRAVYILLVGPIPADREIDHICRVRHCVNPAHLDVVTPKVNVARRRPPRRIERSTCLRGHELILRGRAPSGSCRECRRLASERFRARQRAERA
jgi:hypothetical protein